MTSALWSSGDQQRSQRMCSRGTWFAPLLRTTTAARSTITRPDRHSRREICYVRPFDVTATAKPLLMPCYLETPVLIALTSITCQ